MKKYFYWVLAVSLALFTIAEVGLRMTGVLDFPLYTKDAELGYIQNINQSGVFLNKNRWAINDLHLFGGRYEKTKNKSIFIIGDSIVWCGNPYLYEDRLGVKLESVSGLRVWSAAAGSWSSWSEIGYMKRFPHVVENSDYLIWVLNSGDFSEPTVWSSEYSHPTRKPALATAYVFGKFVLPRLRSRDGRRPIVRPLNLNQVGDTVSFIKSIDRSKRKVLVVLWPCEAEIANGGAGDYSIIKNQLGLLRGPNLEFIDLVDSGILGADCYRDGVHPSAKGVAVVSGYLTEKLVGPAY